MLPKKLIDQVIMYSTLKYPSQTHWYYYNISKEARVEDADKAIVFACNSIAVKNDFIEAIPLLLVSYKKGYDNLYFEIFSFIVLNKELFSYENYVQASLLFLIDFRDHPKAKETTDYNFDKKIVAFSEIARDALSKLNEKQYKYFSLKIVSDIDSQGLCCIDLSLFGKYLPQNYKDVGYKDKILTKAIYNILIDCLKLLVFVDDSAKNKILNPIKSTFYTTKIWQYLRSLFLVHPTLEIKKTYIDSSLCRNWPSTSALVIRPGNVELNALAVYMLDRHATLSAAKTISYEEANSTYNNDISNITWWPRLDPYDNLKILRKNAGWYPSIDQCSIGFEEWAQLYHSSLISDYASIVLSHTETFITLSALDDFNLSEKTLKFGDEDFINYINNESLLIVTQYDDEITSQWDSGGLNKFWESAGFNLNIENLKAIPGPMSIYPYRPNASWLKSYEELCTNIDKEIECSNFSAFIISAGSYGLPVAKYVYDKYKIKSISIGYIVNAYFSIYTKSFKGFSEKHPGCKNWIIPTSINKYKELQSIDNGRYL
ncbi:hypothetical protein [Cobetia crustatorum]|uniref:Uncharacterized protein n=1 Tax=Cobetia crustatorum TaxID=553385 RepID=A0A558HQ78_9GAMM|nr:hypothetical protein [Cobetia crustatorum]TVU71283.1 hypothetical protein FQP86_07090 [Cobetia crustatorum]